jgi:hypothetical protein
MLSAMVNIKKILHKTLSTGMPIKSNSKGMMEDQNEQSMTMLYSIMGYVKREVYMSCSYLSSIGHVALSLWVCRSTQCPLLTLNQFLYI